MSEMGSVDHTKSHKSHFGRLLLTSDKKYTKDGPKQCLSMQKLSFLLL